MRILFVNHTFPGDLGPLLAAFAAQPGHEILFASCRGRRDFSVPGVRHVVLSPSRARRLAGDGAGASLDRAVEMGRQALQAFRLLRQRAQNPRRQQSKTAGSRCMGTAGPDHYGSDNI